MGNFGGFFLKGFAGGLQSGFEMGWKKKQQKELEKKTKELEEGAFAFNNLIKQYGQDGVYSDDEIAQLNTAYLASSYEVKAIIKDSYDAIQTMNKNKVESDFELLNNYSEWMQGLKPDDVSILFESVKNQVKTEKGKQLFEAYNNIYKKKYETMQTQPEDVWGQANILPQEIRPDYLRSKGINVPEVKPQLSAKDNWAIESYKQGKISFDQLSKYMGAYIEPEKSTAKEQEIQLAKQYGATNEEIKNMLIGQASTAKPVETESVTTLKNWEEMFNMESENAPTNETEYNRLLNLLKQSGDNYTPIYPSWKEALIAEVKGIAEELKTITKNEDYNLLLNVYLQKIEEIKTKYPDVDLNQFPTFNKKLNWFQKLSERGKYYK